MADNRVVIKINYDKDKQRKALIDPKMVTVWHTQRILTACVILVLLLILIVSWLLAGDEEIVSEEQHLINANSPAVTTHSPSVISSDTTQDLPKSKFESSSQSTDKSPLLIKRPAAIIFDKRVIRASLNADIKDNQPGTPIATPVKVARHKPLELFYFSEVKNMKGKALYHHWLKNGRVVYKKTWDIKEQKAKLISNKTIGFADAGEWQVLLLDKKGKPLSEVNFEVNSN